MVGTWTLQASDTDPKAVFQDDIFAIADSLRHSVTDANGVTHWRLNADIVEDIFMLCHYSVS